MDCSKLEYRGYDSAGIAVRGANGDAEIVKAKGRLKILAEKTDNGARCAGNMWNRPYKMGNTWGAV